MEIIFEKDIENMDFLEIILSDEEKQKITETGLIAIFEEVTSERNLNINIRTQNSIEKMKEKYNATDD